MSVRRLALIGDIHAEDQRLRAVLDSLATLDVDDIVSTGDIVDGIGSPESCIAQLTDAGVKTVRGNHDRWLLEDKARHVPNAHTRSHLSDAALAYLAELPTQLTVSTAKGDLLLCHGIGDRDLGKVWPGTERMPVEASPLLDSIISEGRHRFMVNGHMHFKCVFRFETLTLVNAGTLSGTRWPGFSILDFAADHIEVYRFDGDRIATPVTEALASDTFEWRDTRDFSGGWQPRVLGQPR